MLTGGAYVNDCLSCHVRLFIEKEPQVKAYCDNCPGSCDRNLHHERRVRVIVTLRPEDFELLCRVAGAQPLQATDRTAFACIDDGECLRYVLNFDPAAGVDTTDLPKHALRHVEALWLDTAAADPLRLGRIADAFIRQSGLSESQRRQFTVFIRQAAPDTAIINKLEALFGNVRYGFEPATLFGFAATANDEGARRELSDKGTAIEITRSGSPTSPEPVDQPRV